MTVSTQPGFSLTPTSLAEAMKMAEIMAGSDMVPKDYQGKPGNVLVAVQMGAELGLKPVQSLQNIAVVNGRPSIWGAGLRALIMSSPDLVDIAERYDDKTETAYCEITRNINGKAIAFSGQFSRNDAEVAGLWGKNVWKSYPKVMLGWRAFGIAATKSYADRLKGISLAEESRDIQPPITTERVERDITPANESRVLLPHYPDADFDANFEKWAAAIKMGKKTPDELIAMIQSKATLSEMQKAKIREIKQEHAA